MYRIIALALVMIVLACVLIGCGEKSDDKSDSNTETTVIIETTSDGGTIEQDADGNMITRAKDGKITVVKDKGGNPIDVTTYLLTHNWAENPNVAVLPSSKSTNKSVNDNTSSVNETVSSVSPSEEIEEEIPTITVEIPADGEEIEIPGL